MSKSGNLVVCPVKQLVSNGERREHSMKTLVDNHLGKPQKSQKQTDRKCIIVRSLTCKSHLNMSLMCLRSLCDRSADDIRLSIHEDGSLTKADIDLIHQHLPLATVITRAEADEVMHQHLRQYSTCTKYRKEHPHGLKLMDLYFLGNEENIAYCDSDVLFFRDHNQLFHFPDNSIGALFMQDVMQAYSVRSWNLMLNRGLKLAAGVNSGLFYFKRKHYDLDLIEWYLSKWGQRLFPSWDEQTCWALLAGQSTTWLWAEDMIQVANHRNAMRKNLVAAHFVGPDRAFPKLEAKMDQMRASGPVTLLSKPTRRCTSLTMARCEAKRLLSRVY